MTKSVLVTGASSGIGRAAALRLAAEGHTVFAAARRLDRLAEVARSARGTVVPVQLDIRDLDSIAQARAEIQRVLPEGIDVLVNNAGYSLIGALETLDSADIRDQYDTNVLGLIEVTRAFLPQMRARRSGRVVNVSSVLGRLAFVGAGVYASTKFAVEGLSDALRQELKAFGIGVVLVEPGFTATEIDTAPSATGAGIADYRDLTSSIAAYNAKQLSGGIGPEKVAEVIARASVTRRPRARYVVPRRYAGLLTALKFTPTGLADSIGLRQLPESVADDTASPAPRSTPSPTGQDQAEPRRARPVVRRP